MNVHWARLVAVAAAIILLVSSCSGGSEGTGFVGDPPQTPSAVSFGTVTQLGSVYVNDVHYVTSDATIRVDDNPGVESDLKVGQTVFVGGTLDSDGANGNASIVTVESVVKGPVDIVYNSATRELGVLGQRIQVTDLTIVDDSLSGGIENLAVDDEIKIHGHVRGNGLVEATLIEDSNVALAEYKVIGFAQSVSATNFSIGNLNIDYSSAEVGDLIGGMPSADQLVEVKLNISNLLATKVEPAGITTTSTNISYVEIEGFVTSFNSSASFTVGNIPVTTSASTVYEGGLPEDIGLGSKLEVDGQLVNGTLTASKVQFRYNVKIEGNVATTDGSTTLTIVGLGGITVNIDGLTEMEGTPVVGNEVRLRGYKTDSNTVTATRFEDRGGSGNRAILQAPVDSEDTGTSITLLGVTVTTTVPGFEFRDVTDMVLSSNAFYNLVDVGTLVKVRGNYSGSSVIWDQAEVED